MRSIVTVAAMALGLGLAGIQTSSAAPAYGTAIQNAADLNQGTEQVQYGYGYRRYRGYEDGDRSGYGDRYGYGDRSGYGERSGYGYRYRDRDRYRYGYGDRRYGYGDRRGY
jgi:hypothetical protein